MFEGTCVTYAGEVIHIGSPLDKGGNTESQYNAKQTYLPIFKLTVIILRDIVESVILENEDA